MVAPNFTGADGDGGVHRFPYRQRSGAAVPRRHIGEAMCALRFH